MYFGECIHDNCRRRSYFEEGKVLTDWNDPKQMNWCLIDKGCKGPDTYSDCSVRRWNDGLNFCIDCSAGCKGCAEPTFYREIGPLYSDTSGLLDEIMQRIKLGSATTSKTISRKEV